MVWASTPSSALRHPGAEAETRTAVPLGLSSSWPSEVRALKGVTSVRFPPPHNLTVEPSLRRMQMPLALRCRTKVRPAVLPSLTLDVVEARCMESSVKTLTLERGPARGLSP